MEAQFLTALRAEKIPGDDINWMIFDPLRFYSKMLDEIITVEDPFTTDFASVPRIPVAYICVGNIAHRPAALHDWCYRKGLYTRKISDSLFLEALHAEGWIPDYKCHVMFEGVKFFGSPCYQGTVDGYELDFSIIQDVYGLRPKEV